MDKLNLPSNQSSQQELSANEFQEKLYNWLQEQGLISELRGHLRMQMVNAFQDNAGSNSSSRQFSLSPKIQALSTLVAEFLLQQGFCYSLSVYVTEVPVIGQVFSQFSQSAIKKTLECGYKFTAREVEDILETLGLIPGSELFSQALCFYQNKPEPLLLCIMRALSTIFKVNRKEPVQSIPSARNECKSFHSCNRDINKSQNVPVRDCDKGRFCGKDTSSFKDEWHNIIDEQNIKPCQVPCAEDYMKRIYEEELCRVREEEAAKYQRLLDEKLKEYEKRDITNKHSGLKEWKERVEMEFNERERNLCQLASQLRAQHQELTEKLSFLEIESQGIKEKEKLLMDEREKDCKELELKRSEMEVQKSKLNEAYERLAADQEAVNRIQKELLEKELYNSKKDDTSSQQQTSNDFFKKLTEQFNSLCHMLTDKKTLGFTYPYPPVPNFDTTVCVVTEDKGLQTAFQDTSSALEEERLAREQDNDLITRIEEEKRELNEHMMQQRQRIEELTIRAAELSNQLQDAQVALQLVRPNRLAVTTPPLTAPPTARLFPRPQWPPHIGSGEETSFAAMNTAPTVANTFTNTTPTATTTNAPTMRQTGAVRRSDIRRRPRRTVVHQNTLPIRLNISSDDSTATTDEMIEEARVRLRRLEMESSNVQRNYEEFRNRQTGLESTASIVFHPDQLRNTNPFDYRHTNISSSFAGYPSINLTRPTNQSRSFSPRLSRVSISRPVLDTFFSDYGERRRNIRLSDFLREDTTKEFDERLENDVMVNKMETMREKIVPPIRTMSPTDLVMDGDNIVQPLKRTVVQNTLKNHSIRKSDKKKTARSVDTDKNDEADLSSADSEKNKVNVGRKKDNKSSFDSTGVGNGSRGFNVSNEIPVFTALGNNFGSNKPKYSSVQPQFKANDRDEFDDFSETEDVRNSDVVRISDIGSDTDLTDDEKRCKINRNTGTNSDFFSSRRVFGKSEQQEMRYPKDEPESDGNSTENETNNTHVIATANKRQKRSTGAVVHFNTSADEEYHDDGSVDVLLKQQSIKTWSSSTQPDSNCNKQDSTAEEVIAERLESEKRVEKDLVKSQSLPVQPLKSFFSCGEDEYTFDNFEDGSVSKVNVQDQSSIKVDTEPSKEQDQWFDAGGFSDKIDSIKNKNVEDGANKENRLVINYELPPLHLADAFSISTEHINPGRISSEHVYDGIFDHCNYPYPSCYRNLLRRVIRRDFEPSWLLKLKLTRSNNCLKGVAKKPDPHDFFFIPCRKSFFNLSMDDDDDDH